MFNQIIIVGRVGGDPEIKYLPSGDPVASFSLATDESYTSKSGEKVNKTEWHNVKAFGKLAEIIASYVKKGKLLLIAGKSTTNTWEDKEGKKHYKNEIIANTMKMLGTKGGGEGKSAEPKEEHEPGEKAAEESDVPF